MRVERAELGWTRGRRDVRSGVPWLKERGTGERTGESIRRLEGWCSQLAIEVEGRCPEVAWNKHQVLGLALMCPHFISPNNAIICVCGTVLGPLHVRTYFKPYHSPVVVNFRDVSYRLSFSQLRNRSHREVL